MKQQLSTIFSIGILLVVTAGQAFGQAKLSKEDVAAVHILIEKLKASRSGLRYEAINWTAPLFWQQLTYAIRNK